MSRATDILTKIRDRYVKRIEEILYDNEDDLMAHADGDGYSNIDQLLVAGEELRQISVILGCMPNDPPPQYPKPETVQVVTFQPISFPLWADQIRAGNYNGAVASLSFLLNISIPLAARCTSHFINLLGRDPKAFAKVQQIRDLLKNRNESACFLLLDECFGLRRDESADVIQFLTQ